MTAADNAHLAEVAGLVSKRAGSEFNMLFRRAHEFRDATSAGSEIRSTTTSDPTGAVASTLADAAKDKRIRIDPIATLEGDLVKARQQVIWWCNRILALADQAVAVDTAQRARAGVDDRTVDDINRSDGYCQACGSPRYHHGIIGDRLILTHGTLKCCESCRSRWRRTTPQTDSAWIEFLEDAKRRGLAARDGIGDVEVAS